MEDLFMQDELFLRRTALYSVQEGNHFVGKEKVFLTSCRSGATLWPNKSLCIFLFRGTFIVVVTILPIKNNINRFASETLTPVAYNPPYYVDIAAIYAAKHIEMDFYNCLNAKCMILRENVCWLQEIHYSNPRLAYFSNNIN